MSVTGESSALEQQLKPVLERPGITGNVEFQKELAVIARRYLDLLKVQYEATMGGYSNDSVHYRRIDANMVQLNDESRECIKLFEVPLKEYMTSYLCPKRPDLWATRSPESEFDRAEAADALLGSLINAVLWPCQIARNVVSRIAMTCRATTAGC